MALTLEDAHLTFQRMFADSRGVHAAEAIRCFKKVHAEALKNIQLQFVAFAGFKSADVVIADAACKVYLIVAKKPAGSTVATWLKGSDHASTAAAAGDLALRGAAVETTTHTFFDPGGMSCANGLTLGGHTSATGNTKAETVDAFTGFAIIGAAA